MKLGESCLSARVNHRTADKAFA